MDRSNKPARMNRLTDGTQYRETNFGIVAVRGKRILHLLEAGIPHKSRELLATQSFDALFRRGFQTSATGRNVAAIKVQ